MVLSFSSSAVKLLIAEDKKSTSVRWDVDVVWPFLTRSTLSTSDKMAWRWQDTRARESQTGGNNYLQQESWN